MKLFVYAYIVLSISSLIFPSLRQIPKFMLSLFRRLFTFMVSVRSQNIYDLKETNKFFNITSAKFEWAALILQVIFVGTALCLALFEKIFNREIVSFFLEKSFCYYDKPVLLCKDHAGTFLSVNATIFMIYAALWALLSNLSDYDYAGIYYNEYFLNIKPRIYKQKRVLLGSLVLLFLSCIFYPCEFYTLIEAFLFCEMICIAVSSIFIYDVFVRDKRTLNEEIWRYSFNGQMSMNKQNDKREM